MVIIFVIGTAGAGKSLFTASFTEWLKVGKQKTITINLDPGVMNLPYAPDIDIRNRININQIMENYNL